MTRSPAWLAIAFLASACGRVGFDYESAAGNAVPGEGPFDGEAPDAAASSSDAGEETRDAASTSRTDASTLEEDAGVEPFVPDDAGSLPTDCAALPDALACTTFDSAKLPSGWFRNVTDVEGDVDIEEGRFDGRVSGVDASACVGTEFAGQSSGSIYFRTVIRAFASLASVRVLAFGGVGDSGANLQLTLFENRTFGVVSASGQVADGSSVRLPSGGFACIDGEVKVHDSAGSVRVRVDGTEALLAEGIDTLPGTGIGDVLLGPSWKTGVEGIGRVIADELVVSTDPLDCVP